MLLPYAGMTRIRFIGLATCFSSPLSHKGTPWNGSNMRDALGRVNLMPLPITTIYIDHESSNHAVNISSRSPSC
jgi:hypothetical protein